MSMTEKLLREKFGIGRDVMKQLRDRAPAEYWARDGSKRPERLQGVVWTGEGVEWLCKEVVRGQEIPAVKLEVAGVEEREFVVSKCDFLNKRILECLDDNGGRVMVKCADSKKFTKNMKIPVRRDGLGWVVARHPRYRGKM